MSIIDIGLRLAGVPSETVDEIEKAMPAVAELVRLFKLAEPLLKEALPLVEQVQPLILKAQPLLAQALPLIAPALKEIDAIMPAVNDVLAFVQQQQKASADPSAQPWTQS